MRFLELWPSWFKANVWSLVAGIPALMLNEALTGWFLPGELGQRNRAYPLFLLLFILVFFSATCFAEFLYGQRIMRKSGAHIGRAALFKGVLLANLVSYAVLGPVYFLIEYPRSGIQEFAPDTSWFKNPALTVLAVDHNGQLEAATTGGHNSRIIVPHEVQDYVLSADLAQVLYRGVNDRLYFFARGTNLMVPELGFRCRAPEMDFSPAGKRAAFFDDETKRVRVYDFTSGRFRDVPTFGDGFGSSLVWSSAEEKLYLKTGKEYWEIELGPDVAYRRLRNSPLDFADHYGRLGNAWSQDGVRYRQHQEGDFKLFVLFGFGNQLVVSSQEKILLRFKDPTGELGIEQAVFLNRSGDVLVGVGDFVYILNVQSRRMGPVMGGQKFIAIAKPFSKQADF